MNENKQETVEQQAQVEASKAEYVAPKVVAMTESEVLSSFQVTAAGTTAWWVM